MSTRHLCDSPRALAVLGGSVIVIALGLTACGRGYVEVGDGYDALSAQEVVRPHVGERSSG